MTLNDKVKHLMSLGWEVEERTLEFGDRQLTGLTKTVTVKIGADEYRSSYFVSTLILESITVIDGYDCSITGQLLKGISDAYFERGARK